MWANFERNVYFLHVGKFQEKRLVPPRGQISRETFILHVGKFQEKRLFPPRGQISRETFISSMWPNFERNVYFLEMLTTVIEMLL